MLGVIPPGVGVIVANWPGVAAKGVLSSHLVFKPLLGVGVSPNLFIRGVSVDYKLVLPGVGVSPNIFLPGVGFSYPTGVISHLFILPGVFKFLFGVSPIL